MSPNRSALTTGQAARCCFVTPDTIVNWIKSDLLPAQRTAGGQYRILLRDLRTFMVDQGMSTELLESEPDSRPMCWQFHERREDSGREASPCEGCVVKFLGVLNCFKLMGMRPEEGLRHEDCGACEYYRRWGDGQTDNRERREAI